MSEASSHSSVRSRSSDLSSLGDHGVEDNLGSQNVQTDRNLLYPGDAVNQAIPRSSNSGSPSSEGGHSTLRVARVIPTTRSATNSPTQEQSDLNYSSSGDDSESDGAANSDDGGGDLDGRSQNFQQARRDYRSVRLNTSENRQRQVARVIPHQYASIRLRQSELFVVYIYS